MPSTTKKAFEVAVSVGKYAQIFDIRLNSTSISKVLAFVRISLAKKSKFFIVTPNPEIISASLNDRKLFEALSFASLRVPDGVGLSQAARFLSLPAPKNKPLRFIVCLFEGLWVGLATFLAPKYLEESLPVIKGRRLFLELTKLANKKGLKIFLLGGEKEEAKKTGERLRRSFKKVRIAYAAGPRLDKEALPISEADRDIEEYVISQINEFRPDILFVGFGAPKQEKWVKKHFLRLSCGGAMVVGGTFRYLAGLSSLPPKWMEEAGLEWFWRLIHEPKRLGRILNAAVVFPWKVFLARLSK